MGLIIFTGSMFLMFLTVPWHQIKRFVLFGVVSGLGIAIILHLVMQNWLGFWLYRKVDLLYLGKIPLILSAAWIPTEIFFAHFLNRCQYFWLRVLLILSLPTLAVGMHFIQIWNRMLTYHHWNYFDSFLVSLGIQLGLALYLTRVYKTPLLS